MSLEEGVVAGMEQADAAANLQKAISLLHPSLVKLILSNPVTSKKKGNKKKDFSKSLQAIINDWSTFFPTGSQFANSKKYFSRAIKIRNSVSHQSFDCSRYQHHMECIAQLATAIGEPQLTISIPKLVAENQDEKNEVDIESKWKSLKEEGNHFYKQTEWNEALNCYTRAIHLNQGEAALYSNRALCELNLSKFDLAREDIEDAIQLDPKNVKCYRVLSQTLLEMKMHNESLETCLQGLDIDPRDDVLIIRERDCRALIASDETDKNPVCGNLFTKRVGFNEEYDKLKKDRSRYNNLHLTAEDIEDYPNMKLSFSIAEAHQYEYGKLSTTQGSQEKAFKIFEAAANQGSAEGLYNMARFCSQGKAGLPRDFNKAVELCRLAASQKPFIRLCENILLNVGVAEAKAFLGNCYRDGRGVEQCASEAFKWYLKAAQHDCPTAQNNLGLALLNGDGCEKNETSAREWFHKAVEYGLAEAQYNYAMVLEEGRGGPIDAKKAAELLKKSADQGTPGALERLQKLSMSGALGGTSMKRTKDDLKKAAKKGDPKSLFLLGQNYLNGTGGLDKDLRQAERYLREASKASYAEAHFPLGKLLLELKKNEEAIQFLKLSAEKGSTEGQFELGILFAYGHGCHRDEANARRWLNRSKRQGLSLKMNKPDEDESVIEDWVERQIKLGQEISEFETQHQLKSEEMSVEERKRRYISMKLDANHPASSTLLEFLEDRFPPGGCPRLTPNIRSKIDVTDESMKEIISRADDGYLTAQSFFKACIISEQAMESLTQQKMNDAFKLFRLSFREWDLTIKECWGFYLDCIEAAKEALDRNSQDADALYVLARMETQSNEEKLRMVKRCVELDPSVPNFHHLLACMLGFVGDHKNGLRAVDRAIEMLPDQLGWLYDRATFLRLTEDIKEKKKYGVDVAEAYLKFLSSNPVDHRKYPEACYCLAQPYVVLDDKTKARMYFQKGLDAEDPRVRLPCFEPVDPHFPPKTMAQRMFKFMEALEKTANTTVAATQQRTTNNCANCFKANQSLRCTACKNVWYCDRACQTANWKKHKVDCKHIYADLYRIDSWERRFFVQPCHNSSHPNPQRFREAPIRRFAEQCIAYHPRLEALAPTLNEICKIPS